jgi:HTH-type transcriptional regulator/antitoxin HigA
MNRATHPGVLIKDEIDATPGLSQRTLAKELGLLPSLLNEIIKGKKPVTADIAILLEKALGISADYWMRFQSQYEIDKARTKPV